MTAILDFIDKVDDLSIQMSSLTNLLRWGFYHPITFKYQDSSEVIDIMDFLGKQDDIEINKHKIVYDNVNFSPLPVKQPKAPLEHIHEKIANSEVPLWFTLDKLQDCDGYYVIYDDIDNSQIIVGLGKLINNTKVHKCNCDVNKYACKCGSDYDSDSDSGSDNGSDSTK